MDGDTDYAGYTRRELEEALGNIDRVRYPKNYERLCACLALAPPDPPSPERHDALDRWRSLLAGALLLVAGAWTIDTMPHLLEAMWGLTLGRNPALRGVGRLVPLVGSLLFLLLYTATIATGLLLWKRTRFATLFGCFVFGAQLLSIRVDGFAYHFATFGAVRLRFVDGSVGLTASLGREFGLGLERSATSYVAIDLLALALILVLIRMSPSRASAN